MYRSQLWRGVVVGLALLLAASSVESQWVMVARAASGRVKRMKQGSGDKGYDVATVILEAASDRVYETALQTLKANTEFTITKQDKQKGKLEFRKGKLIAGFQISPLADKVTLLTIASNESDAATPGSTSLVVDGVLRVCKEMKVQCSVEAE